MTFKSGKHGRVLVGTTEYPVISWSVTPSVDHVEFRNSMTGNHTVIDPTFFPPVAIDVVIDWDLDTNPFSTGPNLTVGNFVSNVSLYPNGTAASSPTGDKWAFPSAMVKSTPQDCTIDGKIGTRVQLMSSGLYTYPGGTDPTSNLT